MGVGRGCCWTFNSSRFEGSFAAVTAELVGGKEFVVAVVVDGDDGIEEEDLPDDTDVMGICNRFNALC